MVVGVSAAYAERARDVYDSEALSGNVRDHPGQLVDRDHFLGTDIHRPGEFRVNQAADTLEAFIDIEERASLLAVAPDLDLRNERVCSPSPQISISPRSSASATLRHSAAGAFSLPPAHVPSGPKILWKRAIRTWMP